MKRKWICDNCKKQYSAGKSFYLDTEEGKKWVSWCEDCLGTRITGRSDKQMEEYINTPYWVHMGLKPKAEEKTQLKYMKDHNMNWTDMAKTRNLEAKTEGGMSTFKKHQKEYGTKNAPNVKIGKEN